MTSPAGLDAGYRPLPELFDEMALPGPSSPVGGRLAPTLREHWAHLGRVFTEELDRFELQRRAQETERLLDADGVTYTVVGEGTRRWLLDPVPAVVPSTEWNALENGIIQRAEVLNALLTDLYGDRSLVRRGVLPPEIVFTHPGFLRSCDQIRVPGPQQLITYAIDLARDATGTWTVLSDRTQAPSGFGYALENRVVVSRVFPSLYRDAHVHRLAPFFRALRSALQRLAPPNVDDPRIVVLTPGRFSETAFEHAFLASTLGYTLVEGADLVARDGQLAMRSLGRLERVDVVLRRVDAEFCDPLELRPDSHLGVPGLVELCRTGAVSVVNTLGSGVLENPALHAFLPAVARAVIGQELVLPAAPTWWCGDDLGRRHVLANLGKLVVKPIGRGAASASVFGWELSTRQLDDLRRRIEAQPSAYVGQEPLPLSSTPTCVDGVIEPRRSTLRAFAVCRNDSYVVMPGGLTRVSPNADSTRISNQAGALSKDTWVLASEPEQMTGFWLHSGPAIAAVDPAASMPSRAAENLFWLGRYAERAEAAIRLLRAVYDRRNDFQGSPNPAGTACLRALLVALTEVTTTYPGFVAGPGAEDRIASPGDELAALVVDSSRPGTLAHAVRGLLDAAAAVRDQLSGDTFLVVGSLDQQLELLDQHQPGVDRQAAAQSAVNHVMQSLLALAGLGAESMVRDPGWQFMEAGRRIERALQLTALLRSTMVTVHDKATDSLLLESVLVATESIITYRRRYRSQAQAETMLDLLLLDPGNPRSLRYQLDHLQTAVSLLPRPTTYSLASDERAVVQAVGAASMADTEVLASAVVDGRRVELERHLVAVHGAVSAAALAIDGEHFTHLLPQRMLLAGSG